MLKDKPKVGVLALQGDVYEHLRQLRSLGCSEVAIKQVNQLADLDALILPGGESTTIGKLMAKYGFIEALKDFSGAKKPILGTCAGMILLAKQISNNPNNYLELIDITVQRNAFGRQVDSFETTLKINGLDSPVPAVFIRAPVVKSIDSNEVEVLAWLEDQPVFVRQHHLFACAFHPELTNNPNILKLFLTSNNLLST